MLNVNERRIETPLLKPEIIRLQDGYVRIKDPRFIPSKNRITTKIWGTEAVFETNSIIRVPDEHANETMGRLLIELPSGLDTEGNTQILPEIRQKSEYFTYHDLRLRQILQNHSMDDRLQPFLADAGEDWIAVPNKLRVDFLALMYGTLSFPVSLSSPSKPA